MTRAYESAHEVNFATHIGRLGILVDFLSHSTITGFMGGTATLICLQQLKGMFGLKHFTTHTDMVSVLRAILSHRDEWRWESAVVGIIFLIFLQFTRYVKRKKPSLFWVSAIAPMVTVLIGCLFAYFAHAEKHGIQIVGDLKKGINPSSIQRLTFDPKYISAPLKAGLITAMVALAEGIAIGRSFAIMRNDHIDGNKEMMAFGLMNIVGSFTSCYLTTGPFSKTAVNFNAGCRTAMANVVMAVCMMLTLLFLAPLFSYTPLVALSAIIMSAMLGLIDYEKAYHLYKTDKFDFCICMIAFFGVAFISMDVGLMMSVGDLKKGINPSSIQRLTFDPKYISAPLKAGLITAMVALAEGIAIGRSFAIMRNDHIDGNKEMMAFGLMNIVGSFTSCYLTTGPFSKTAVNFNAGCRTAMANVVMAVCMMLTLLFLAPLFSYTPLVALSAIIMSAMLGLIDYEKAYHLYKTDKFDFCICMIAFFGVAFISMDVGLMMSVGLALLRGLLYVARPGTCKLANIPDSTLYRDVEQYPGATGIPGILILQLGSPIYFANSSYIRERILRWVRDEQDIIDAEGNDIEYLLLDLGGVTAIDITGIETLCEVRKNMESKGIKVTLINPRIKVMEKLMLTKFIDEEVGKESVFLSIEDAIEACRFSLKISNQTNGEDFVDT
ncbi:unnamed protein product [Ilex paraguariensis]|uniref:STAS domain-containing protein n=1 Tax=Ilex paraguariensis TaxID=185542 RepID=A0ABC8S794_9AQUA